VFLADLSPGTAFSAKFISELTRGGTWMQRWRVPLGFVCAAVFLVFARPSPLTLLIGAVVALPGLALRAWASGYLRKNDALATAGPYAYTRNPLYLGSFLIGLGFTVAAARWSLGLLFLGLFAGIYVPVMRVESQTLADLFGESYRHYAVEVPVFFPRLYPYSSGGGIGATFDMRLYRRYREYRATIGLVLAWGLLAAKATFIK
jgi:protein-S-isoprenylcysteine O-methyltransferase Ste14